MEALLALGHDLSLSLSLWLARLPWPPSCLRAQVFCYFFFLSAFLCASSSTGSLDGLYASASSCSLHTVYSYFYCFTSLVCVELLSLPYQPSYLHPWIVFCLWSLTRGRPPVAVSASSLTVRVSKPSDVSCFRSRALSIVPRPLFPSALLLGVGYASVRRAEAAELRALLCKMQRPRGHPRKV